MNADGTSTHGRMELTREIAFAAGMDAANSAMRKRLDRNPKRTARWTAKEAGIAARTTNRLLMHVPFEKGGLGGLNLSPRDLEALRIGQ